MHTAEFGDVSLRELIRAPLPDLVLLDALDVVQWREADDHTHPTSVKAWEECTRIVKERLVRLIKVPVPVTFPC